MSVSLLQRMLINNTIFRKKSELFLLSDLTCLNWEKPVHLVLVQGKSQGN